MVSNKVILLIYHFPYHRELGTYYKHLNLEVQGRITDYKLLHDFLLEQLVKREGIPVVLTDSFIIAE